VVRGLGCGASSLLMFLSHFRRLLDICFDGGREDGKQGLWGRYRSWFLCGASWWMRKGGKTVNG